MNIVESLFNRFIGNGVDHVPEPERAIRSDLLPDEGLGVDAAYERIKEAFANCMSGHIGGITNELDQKLARGEITEEEYDELYEQNS